MANENQTRGKLKLKPGTLNMGLRIGDRVEVNYSVDDFPGHVGIVKNIKESTEFPRKTIVVCYWPFLNKEIAFSRKVLNLSNIH